MTRFKGKTIFVFVLGMVTFAVGYFIVKPFVIVERPTINGLIQDWERICFWLDDGAFTLMFLQKGVIPQPVQHPNCRRALRLSMSKT